MNKNILKYSFLLALLIMVVVSCSEDEVDTPIITPEPEFELGATDISSLVLNATYPDNPAFSLSWDEGTISASSYNITASTTDDFAAFTTLGTSEVNSFSITVAALNSALIGLGADPYGEFRFFVRVEGGGETTEPSSFSVATYAINPPTIASLGDDPSFVLSATTAQDSVTTISWADFNPANTRTAEISGIEVQYDLEAAVGGTDFATVVSGGSVSNESALVPNAVTWTHKQLNDLSLALELPFEEEGEIDLRIRATVVTGTSEDDENVRVSDPVTITVTPYNAVAFPIYLIGGATAAGWNNPADPVTNHHPLFPDLDNPNQYSYTGYFSDENGSNFKVIQSPGGWVPQWGAGADNTLLFRPDDETADPPAFDVPAAGYYELSFDIGVLTYSLTPFDASGAPDYTSNGMGITGAGVGGWDDPARIPMTQSSHDIHIWYATGVEFFDDEFKFKETNGWGVNFGVDGPNGDNSWPYDQAATIDGGNIRATAGTYTVFFNDLTGDYWMIEE